MVPKICFTAAITRLCGETCTCPVPDLLLNCFIDGYYRTIQEQVRKRSGTGQVQVSPHSWVMAGILPDGVLLSGECLYQIPGPENPGA